MDCTRNAIDISTVEFDLLNGSHEEVIRTFLVLKDCRALDSMYWDVRDKYHHDIVKFANTYTEDSPSKLCRIRSDTQILGFFTITNHRPQDSVEVGVFFFGRYRGGVLTKLVSRCALDMIRKLYKVPKIYAFTPWEAAYTLALNCGMKEISVLPGYYYGHDVHVLLDHKDVEQDE
jgi:hypothetical protein